MARARTSGGSGRWGVAPPGTPDVHEAMKAHMFASRDPSCDAHFNKSVPCPSDVYGIQDSYLELDSYAKTTSSDMAKGRLSFNFNVGGPTTDDAIGTRTEVPTVIEMLLEPFTVGLPDDLWDETKSDADAAAASVSATATGTDPTGSALLHPMGQLPYGERITVQFQEFGRQARVGRDPHTRSVREHHIECEASLGGMSDRLEARPLSGERGYYVFVDPVKDVHNLTVVLRGVDRPLALPADTFKASPAVDTGDLLFTWSSASEGTSATAMPPLSEDDRIFVRGFASGNGRFDSYVNRPDGHLVSSGDLTSSTFRLKPGFSGLALSISSATVTISVAKNRIRLNLRVRSVVDRLTNYISP